MKKLLLASAMAVLPLSAFAADLPMRAPAAAPVYAAPIFTWTGFYIGAQIGYAWDHDRTVEFTTATGVATGFARSFSPAGVVGGAFAGYNIQSGAFVYGLEADIEASGVRGSYTNIPANTGTRAAIDWQGSIRARLGYAFGNALLYIQGGGAFANLKETYFNAAAVNESFSDTRFGWTIGAGLEYAFSPNWTARVEYRYTDYGNFRNNSLVAFPGFTYQNEQTQQTVRVGIAYKFGGPAAPVVAKY